jgi:hypothetical protein
MYGAMVVTSAATTQLASQVTAVPRWVDILTEFLANPIANRSR